MALDGKTLRHSCSDATDRQPLHRVHVFATGTKLVLAQAKVDGKSNEITTLPALLDLLDIQGRTVTLDALHTQRETARAITDAGGTYIGALKGNQKTLYKDIKRYLEDPIRRHPSRSRVPMLTRGMAGLKPIQHRFVMTLIGWGA